MIAPGYYGALLAKVAPQCTIFAPNYAPIRLSIDRFFRKHLELPNIFGKITLE